MAQHERSAGIVVFRTPESAPAQRLYLALDYGRHWDLPKGHVEAGEDDLSAARRELREETGITEIDLVEGFSQEIAYFFRSKQKGLIHKRVVFFLARTPTEQVSLSHEHVGWAWLEYPAILRQLTYPTARQVLEAAETHLSNSAVR